MVLIVHLIGVRPCPKLSFQCNNNQCIDINWKCDHDFDCDDHSDEKNCSKFGSFILLTGTWYNVS